MGVPKGDCDHKKWFEEAGRSKRRDKSRYQEISLAIRKEARAGVRNQLPKNRQRKRVSAHPITVSN
jgi:hypothetical protein